MITMFYGCSWTPDEVTAQVRDATDYYDPLLEWGRFGEDDQGIFLAVKSTATIETEDAVHVPLGLHVTHLADGGTWDRLLGWFLETAGVQTQGKPVWQAVWHESP